MTTNPGTSNEARVTGFRTFLIADVRGYTVYTREQGDEAAAALAAAFASAVREVVGTREGYLLELRGDEALVVFESPRQALRAAVELQKKFAEVELPRGVGIGLDAGEAVPTEGGYRGGALNLAARLCGQAAAGEILASETVIHLAAHIEGVEYVDARTLRLKGFTDPVRAVEVAASGSARRGLSRRVRRARLSLRLHWRLALVAIVGLGVGGAALAIANRPPPAPALAPSPSPPPRLADLPSGIVLIDPTTGKDRAHIETSTIKQPVDAVYADGSFWILNIEPVSLVQIDATTGAIERQISASFPDVGSFTADGKNLWVSDFAHPAIARIDIASGREVDRFDLSKEIDNPDDGFAGLVVGDGSLWVGGKDRGQIFRIDPKNGALQATISDAGSWVTASGDGTVWTGSFAGLFRIDPTTNTALHTAVPVGHVGNGVAGGAGYGWTADENKGVVFKVDPAGRVAATYQTGIGARAVSFSDGTLWVANQDEGTVGGIDAITGKMRTLTFGHPTVGIASGSGSLLVLLGAGRSYEDRIDALQGKVARLFMWGYDFGDGDPATEWTREAFTIEQATCAHLVSYLPDATGVLRLEPEVATAMPTISPDGRTYSFQVKPGFAFSDASAEPVTAETFRHSIERALSPGLGEKAYGRYFLADVEGVAAFRDGSSDHISGLRVEGDTLSVTLIKPSGDLISRLAMPFFCPVPADTAFAPEAVSRPLSTEDGFVETVASTGPYYVADLNNGEYVILERNRNYRGTRTAAFDAIAIREGVDAGVAVERVDSGSWDGIVDMYDQIFSPTGELAGRWGPASEAAKSGDRRYYSIPDGGVWYLEFNSSRKPFSDQRVRNAVSLAIDRRAAAAASTSDFNQALAWDNLLGPSMTSGAGASTEVPQPDIEAAKTLIGDRAGTKVRLAVSDGCQECNAAASTIVRDLTAIGLDVETVSVPDSYQAIRDPKADYDMRIGATSPDLVGAASFLDQVLSMSLRASWLPGSIQSIGDTLRPVTGEDREARARELANGLLARELPVAVYGYTVRGAYFGPTMGCIQFSPIGTLDLTALCPAP